MAKRDNHTLVMVTHDPSVAAHADRVVNILDGLIVDIVDQTGGRSAPSGSAAPSGGSAPSGVATPDVPQPAPEANPNLTEEEHAS